MTQTTKTERAAARAKKRRRLMLIRRVKVGAALCIVLAVLLYLLSAFVFFKIDTIEVLGTPDENGDYTSGSSYYLAEDIIKVSGVQTGDSLVRVPSSDIARSVETILPYIGKVVIKRKYPSTLRLIVEDTSPCFALETGGYYTVLDRNYKTLGTETEVPNGCAKVVGAAVKKAETGYKAEFNDSAFSDRIDTIISACGEAGISNITKIDLSNIANVGIVLGSRVTMRLGTLTQLDKKLELGKKTMEAELNSNPEARIIIELAETDRSYVRDDYSPYEDPTVSDDITDTDSDNGTGDVNANGGENGNDDNGYIDGVG